MKIILAKLGVLLLLVGLPYLVVKTYYVRHFDGNYYKANGQANHLIIGLSRAKRGLVPAVFLQELGLEGSMLNFAFNNMESPYGPLYYQAIRNKVMPNETNGLFILSVCPGAVMDLRRDNGTFGAREKNFFFYKLWCKNCRPNLEYILRSPIKQGSLFQFLRNRFTGIYAHSKLKWPEMIYPDGWAELNAAYRYKRSRPIILEREFRVSEEREAYLSKTIAYLKNYGTVVLVRLPVGPTYLRYENELYPDFDSVINEMADYHQVTYLNYLETQLSETFHDGHHLFGDEARIISQNLAKDLKSKVID